MLSGLQAKAAKTRPQVGKPRPSVATTTVSESSLRSNSNSSAASSAAATASSAADSAWGYGGAASSATAAGASLSTSTGVPTVETAQTSERPRRPVATPTASRQLSGSRRGGVGAAALLLEASAAPQWHGASASAIPQASSEASSGGTSRMTNDFCRRCNHVSDGGGDYECTVPGH